MADDALVLVAQVYDEFSAPIRRMQTQLRQLTDANRRSHIEGVGLAKAHGESFTRLRESVTKTSEVFKRDFAPMLERVAEQATGVRFAFLGIAGSTAAAVGAASAMSFAFAGTAYRLNALKTATGLSFNELRGLELLAPRIGTSVEALDSGFELLAGHMERLHRNSPAEIASMAASMFPEVRSKVAQLANLPREKQFEGILSIGEQIKNNRGRGGGVANEKLFLEFFGLPPNFADYSKSELLKFYSVYRQQNRDFTEKEQLAAIAAQTAWLDLRQKMQSFSDYVGSAFVPSLNTGLNRLGDEFTSLSSGATAWFSKLMADPNIARSWDDISTRVGADIKALVDGLSTFDDTATRPRVLPAPLAPGWVGVGQDIKNLSGDADQIARLVDALNAKKVDWSLVFDLSGFKGMREQFEQSLAPGGFWHRFREFFDAINARAGIKPPGAVDAGPTRPAAPHTPTPSGPVADPSVLVKNAWAWIRHNWQADAPPTAPATPPPSLPPIAPTPAPPPFTFHKPEIGPPTPRPAFSPIAYNPADGVENPLIDKGASGSSSGTSGAIAIIAAGVRKGGYDALTDFYQSMKNLKDRTLGGGVMPASYETGAGGPGGGAGGGGGAAAIGNAVRRQSGASGDDPGASGGGSGTGRKFMDALSRIESGDAKHPLGRNIYSGVDPDVAGPNSRSQGYFQINTPTWRDFAGKAGVDLSKYPDAMHSPRDVQEKVASVIPLSRFGPRTRSMLMHEFGPLDVRKPVGQLVPRDAPVAAAPPGGTLTSDYAALRLKSQEAVAGGPVERGLAALAKHEQDAEGNNFNVFSALRDHFHVFENPRSAHNLGLAFDATTRDKDYDAARERMRSYLNKLGLKEGDMQGRSGDYAIEPGTYDHIHAQFNSREASERYYAMVTSKADKYAALHDRPPMQGQHELAKHGEALREMFGHRERKDRSLGQEVRREPGSLLRAADQRQAAVQKHSVSGEASLKIALASGLKPVGGVKSSGNLFKQIQLDRASPLPLANTTG